ncbi:hypothetical protein BD410DRAFT_809382 [Rickenella mellea]|uniref:Uncharacterized protein n=1 Tax=Rickenella mellea TaxID=50990 RepID=A0A4Y7PHN1_9AGAM|nr:hypothetical protein BD410DRAFT_809382 [Rickenella mellea]
MWTSPEQLAFLETRERILALSKSEKNRMPSFWTDLKNDWIAQFGTALFDAPNIKGSPTGMTRIKQWFNNRRNMSNSKASRSGSRGLLKMRKKQRYQDAQAYLKLYCSSKIAPALEEEYPTYQSRLRDLEKGLHIEFPLYQDALRERSNNKDTRRLAFMNTIARYMLSIESDAVKAEVAKLKELGDTEPIPDYIASATAEFTPEQAKRYMENHEYQRNQDGVVRFVDKFLKTLYAKAGLQGYLVLGGCEPKNGGDLVTMVFETDIASGKDFSEYMGPKWEEMLVLMSAPELSRRRAMLRTSDTGKAPEFSLPPINAEAGSSTSASSSTTTNSHINDFFGDPSQFSQAGFSQSPLVANAAMSENPPLMGKQTTRAFEKSRAPLGSSYIQPMAEMLQLARTNRTWSRTTSWAKIFFSQHRGQRQVWISVYLPTSHRIINGWKALIPYPSSRCPSTGLLTMAAPTFVIPELTPEIVVDVPAPTIPAPTIPAPIIAAPTELDVLMPVVPIAPVPATMEPIAAAMPDTLADAVNVFDLVMQMQRVMVKISNLDREGWSTYVTSVVDSLDMPTFGGMIWDSVIGRWVGLERIFGFLEASPTGHKLGTFGRPAEFAVWLKDGRPYDNDPEIKNVSKFATNWRTWWAALQPQERLPATSPPWPLLRPTSLIWSVHVEVEATDLLPLRQSTGITNPQVWQVYIREKPAGSDTHSLALTSEVPIHGSGMAVQNKIVDEKKCVSRVKDELSGRGREQHEAVEVARFGHSGSFRHPGAELVGVRACTVTEHGICMYSVGCGVQERPVEGRNGQRRVGKRTVPNMATRRDYQSQARPTNLILVATRVARKESREGSKGIEMQFIRVNDNELVVPTEFLNSIMLVGIADSPRKERDRLAVQSNGPTLPMIVDRIDVSCPIFVWTSVGYQLHDARGGGDTLRDRICIGRSGNVCVDRRDRRSLSLVLADHVNGMGMGMCDPELGTEWNKVPSRQDDVDRGKEGQTYDLYKPRRLFNRQRHYHPPKTRR